MLKTLNFQQLNQVFNARVLKILEDKIYQKISTKLTLPFGKGEEKQKKKVFLQINNDL